MHSNEPERFEGCEHEDIADNIKLSFYGRGAAPCQINANDPDARLTIRKFNTHSHNTRGIVRTLTFGKICAFAGDFYGVPNQPIAVEGETALGQISALRRKRAIDAFSTIGDWTDDTFDKMKKEIINNSKFLQKERAYLEKGGARKSTDPFGIISYHGFEDAIFEAYEKNATTNFFYFIHTPGKHGDKLKALTENNYDHFQPYAQIAYEVFHALALEEATKARSEHLTPNDKNGFLRNAYAIEAFGCHFLGDSFASGHMRVPRYELPKSTTFAIGGHVLCNKMHNEDNKHGLRVTSRFAQAQNPQNPYWIAYGDKLLHHKKNSTNFKYAIKAIQCAVDEVFKASQIDLPNFTVQESRVFDYIPYVDTAEGMNNAPMFQIRTSDGKLCRRKKLNDLQCKELTENWTAPGTISQLQRSTPKNTRWPINSGDEEQLNGSMDTS